MNMIETVARALCKARDTDPDQVSEGPDLSGAGGPGSTVAMANWKRCEQEAKEFLAMHRAAT